MGFELFFFTVRMRAVFFFLFLVCFIFFPLFLTKNTSVLLCPQGIWQPLNVTTTKVAYMVFQFCRTRKVIRIWMGSLYFHLFRGGTQDWLLPYGYCCPLNLLVNCTVKSPHLHEVELVQTIFAEKGTCLFTIFFWLLQMLPVTSSGYCGFQSAFSFSGYIGLLQSYFPS